MSFFDGLDEGFELGVVGGEDKIVVVDSLNWTVGWNADDLHVVDGLELFFLGLSSTGHAGELLVETEEVLVSDGRENNGFLLDLDAFFGLDGLLETIVIFTAWHDTTSKLVD